MKFESPTIEYVKFDMNDIIATSTCTSVGECDTNQAGCPEDCVVVCRSKCNVVVR